MMFLLFQVWWCYGNKVCDRPLGSFSSHILAAHIPLEYKHCSFAKLGRLFYLLSTESRYVIIY